jgi:dipeptidase
LGLEKWLKSDEQVKTTKKETTKTEKKVKKAVSKPEKKENKESRKGLSKFILVCSNGKCKYQKTIMKKIVTEKDKICPRCNKRLKVKNK